VGLLFPLNFLLSIFRKNAKYENSVLHISFMVHEPYYNVRLLREHGMKADYLAVGTSQIWNLCDFQLKPSRWPFLGVWREFWVLWTVIAKYEVIHCHFMITSSHTGWELRFLKRMGRKVVIRYAGCEIRDREKNMKLHPEVNICQNCDYNAEKCTAKLTLKRRKQVNKYGDLFLVSTPDMKDFVPDAIHFPFFAPTVEPSQYAHTTNRPAEPHVKLVHATVHPGIEGTAEIERVVNRLKAKGYKINFVFLKMVPHQRVLSELADANMAIGKMKMGYYANAQIESMALGVPTITYVRPEFMTDDLRESGFIFTTLEELEQTLEYYLTHPEELEKKRRIARSSVLRLHNNAELCRRLIGIYDSLKMHSEYNPRSSAAVRFKRDPGHG
jgi:hypothetical protein